MTDIEALARTGQGFGVSAGTLAPWLAPFSPVCGTERDNTGLNPEGTSRRPYASYGIGRLVRGSVTPAPQVPMDTVASAHEGEAVRGGTGSCVRTYSPRTISDHLDFALDGTVIAFRAPRSNKPGVGKGGLVGAELWVNRWYKGGSNDTVVVDMPDPRIATAGMSPVERQRVQDFGIGTRLLVSGAARWGGDDPLASAIAWWGCGGFTRYYGDAVAAQWADLIH